MEQRANSASVPCPIALLCPPRERVGRETGTELLEKTCSELEKPTQFTQVSTSHWRCNMGKQMWLNLSTSPLCFVFRGDYSRITSRPHEVLGMFNS